MGFFEKAKQTLTIAGREMGVKANELSSTTKIKLSIRDAEKNLRESYEILGRQLMEEKADIATQLAPDLVEAIENKINEIEELKAELVKVKEEAKNVLRCPSCGRIQVSDASSCEFCGTALQNIPAQMEEEIDSSEIENEEAVEEEGAAEEEKEPEEIIAEEKQMKSCPGCGNKIQDEDTSCVYCGMEL